MTVSPAMTAIVAVGVLLLAYPLAMRGLAELMQPKRLELAALGRRILSDAAVDDAVKADIESLLDHAYSWKTAPVVVATAPAVALAILLFGRKGPLSVLTGADAARLELHRFLVLYVLSAMAANPVFAVIAAVEGLVVALLAWPIVGVRGLSDLLAAALLRGERVRNGPGRPTEAPTA